MVSGWGIGLGVAGGVAAVVGLWHGLTYYEVDVKCEKPKYTVIKTIGEKKKSWLGSSSVEIRRYVPLLIAEVCIEKTDMRGALSSGFRQIAGFIFGKNVVSTGEGNTTIAMTSPVTLEVSDGPQEPEATFPVTAEKVNDATYKVSFIMPSKYTKENLPSPMNENVQIREIQARTMAALRWRGRSPSQDMMQGKAEELRTILKEAGIEPKGSMHLWQYHPYVCTLCIVALMYCKGLHAVVVLRLHCGIVVSINGVIGFVVCSPFAPAWMRVNEVLYECDA